MRADKKKVTDEVWDDARVQSFLEPRPVPDGDSADFALLLNAYQGMRPEDFGFVTFDEFSGELLGDNPGAISTRLAERRDVYDRFASLVPPFVFSGAAAPPEEWESRSADAANALSVGDSIQGYPGCPGVAEGRARVILDSHDPFALEPGDILVAPKTSGRSSLNFKRAALPEAVLRGAPA